MRQVPETNSARYLIIGNGRVARHFQHYFQQLNLSSQTWHRRESLAELQQRIAQSTHLLLLISDKAIDEFAALHLQDSDKILIHFSGSLVSEKVYGVHPLLSFTQELYDLPHYQAFTFVVDDDAPDFSALLPGVPNQHVRLAKLLKAKYHALCVLACNFSCILWQKLFSNFEKEFNFPAAIAQPLIKQQTKNLCDNYQAALTGPLVRNDTRTMAANLAALQSDPFQEIYKSFVTCYQQINEEK